MFSSEVRFKKIELKNTSLNRHNQNQNQFIMKKSFHCIAKLLLLVLPLVWGGFTLQAQDADALGNRLIKQLQDKLNANDAEAVTALNSKDQISYWGGGAADIGIEELQEGDQKFFSKWNMEIQYTPKVNKMLSKNYLLQFGKANGKSTSKGTGISF